MSASNGHRHILIPQQWLIDHCHRCVFGRCISDQKLFDGFDDPQVIYQVDLLFYLFFLQMTDSYYCNLPYKDCESGSVRKYIIHFGDDDKKAHQKLGLISLIINFET